MTFQAEIDGVTVDGVELPKGQSAELVTDAQNADKQSIVAFGSLSFFIIKRGTRFAIRLKDSQAPSLLSFTVCCCDFTERFLRLKQQQQ